MNGSPRPAAENNTLEKTKRIKLSKKNQEEYFFNAVKKYKDQPKRINNKILNRLVFILLLDQCTKWTETLDILLELLNTYLKTICLQRRICKTLSLFCRLRPTIVRNVTIKRSIITAFMNSIIYHNYDVVLVSCLCKTIKSLRIQNQDVMFEFERLMEMFNHILCYSTNYSHGMDLILSAITCVCYDYPMNNAQKINLGNHDIIAKLLLIIHGRKIGNERIKLALGTINNITKDIPANCKKLIDSNIINYFVRYLKIFPTQIKLFKYMIRSLNNVAQVEELRPAMMNEHFIVICCDFMFLIEFEISYYAAGIIAYLSSGDKDSWHINALSIEEVLSRLSVTIGNWDRNFDDLPKSSLKPLLQLAQAKHSSACVLYAVWTLENLTLLYPEEYCITLIVEGGLDILVELLEENYTPLKLYGQPWKIDSLAQSVIHRCMSFKGTTIEETKE